MEAKKTETRREAKSENKIKLKREWGEREGAMPKTANLRAEQESANAGENNANVNVNARNAHITHLFIYQPVCVCVCACVRECVRVLACSEA